MDARKMVTIQHQIRQNQEEFNEYVQGLSSWADDMKAKEAKTKSSASEAVDVDVPPVRNSLLKKKKKKKVKPTAEQKPAAEPKTKKKINAYDYRAWDKFDVDAAVAEVDDEEGGTKKDDDDEYETDDEWEEQRRLLLAKEEKDKGNAHFKASRWDEAVECYTTAIRLDPTNAVLYTNRAMAQIRANRLAAAEADCSSALRLEPANCKAYYRRGLARKGLGKGHEADALADFEKVVELDPDSKAARAEVQALEKIVRPTGEVKAIFKDPAACSKKPLRRIEIEEVGFAESKGAAARKPEPALSEFLKERSGEKKAPSAAAAPPVSTSLTPASVLTAKTATPPPTAPAVVDASGEKAAPRHPVPLNFNQFESSFASLKYRGDAELRPFLLAIPPAQYARIFGQCLEPRHVNALVAALSTADDDRAAAGLAALRRVPRFNFLAMMTGGPERERVRALRQRLWQSGRISEGEFDQIGKEFRL